MGKKPNRTELESDDESGLSRRSFLGTLAATAYVAPTIASFTLAAPRPAAASHDEASSTGEGDPNVIFAEADTFIRHDAPYTNEGGNPYIRVGVDPLRYGLVGFAPSKIAAVASHEGFEQATVYLTLDIAVNHNTWGQSDDRVVNVHPLNVAFVEGNGRQSGLSGADGDRGTGPGATWQAPDDPDVSDSRPRLFHGWRYGDVGKPTAPGVLHVNGTGGTVEWDVTADVQAGVSSWQIRVAPHGEERWPDVGPGEEPFAGAVDYHSREGAASLPPGEGQAPRLVFVFEPADGGGEGSVGEA